MHLIAANMFYVQEICETLKNSVRTLLSECASLLGELTSLIVRIYEECPHFIVLDITKTVSCQLKLTLVCWSS